MLKFLVDESSGSKLNKALKERGYDSLYCGQLFRGYSDEDLIKEAENNKRVIITNDKDFGELVFRRKSLSDGIIFLRLKIDNPANRIKSVLSLIQELKDNLNKSFVIVTESKIRIRKL